MNKLVNILILVMMPVFIQAQNSRPALEVGTEFPDISVADVNGEKLSLSTLRGSVVLVDFWASWCGPCRYENKNVVSVYEKFKDTTFKSGNGFKIYSVSLDINKEAWQAAIQNDRLSWPDHVCDFGGWRSEPALKLGIHSIPSNFLLDANGIIIAKNLRGEDLNAKIEELLNGMSE